MKEVSTHVGNRIRLYRKTKNLTIETFAGMINKSKATISKYENGDISIDIETLFVIANALNISINQLVDYETQNEQKANENAVVGARKAEKKRLYMYFYDGRRGRIIKNAIEMQSTEEHGIYDATLYSYLDDFSNLYSCKYLFHGTMNQYDSFTILNFVNQSNKVERVFLYGINSFNHSGRMMAMFSGLSINPMLPIALKAILSPDLMEENDELKELLTISKDDIKNAKKMNMFVISESI